MITCAFLFIILFTGTQYVTGAPSSNYVYSREADAWLRLHMVPTTWSDAGMRCYLEGGVLASPTNSDTASIMAAIMSEHRLTFSVFTGINSILIRENFTSLEGVPLSSIPLPWAAGQPDNDNSDENCLALNPGGELEDVSCQSRLPYFCRKESAQKCGNKDNGYEFEARTGSCYKFHRNAQTWRKALSTCHAEGGYLAIVNSQTESLVFKELFEKNPIELHIGATEPKHAFVGFTKYYDNEWATINGERLASTGFTGWDQSEPNNFHGYEACGSVHRNGLLNDAACAATSPFICEITP